MSWSYRSQHYSCCCGCAIFWLTNYKCLPAWSPFLKENGHYKMMFFCPKLWWYLICPPCWTNLSFFTKVGWLCEGLTWKPLNSCLTQGLEPMDYQPVLSRHTSRRHSAVIFIVMYSGRLKNMFYLYYFQIFYVLSCCKWINPYVHCRVQITH